MVKAVFVASLPPFLLKTPATPNGVNLTTFDGVIAGVKQDRHAYFGSFFADFYNSDENLGARLSPHVLHASWQVAVGASASALAAAVPTWITDFRDDIPHIDVPTLIVHGTADRILPIDATGRPFRAMLLGAEYVEIDGAPHGLLWTHADEVSQALLDFLAK